MIFCLGKEKRYLIVGENSMNKGIVYLIGAGPGDPDLLTVKASKILKKSEVVVYDRLVPKSLLKMIPNEVEKIYVGKSNGLHIKSQKEIQQILIDKAKSGKKVVRLKGGDPFLFGRGGEEMEDLVRAGIIFEVVPGVTSALAVPAYAGIPVTHRRYASSLAIVTGHEDLSKKQIQVKWRNLAKAVDTIVVLMGIGMLKLIASELILGGRPPQTEVAVVEWGTTKRQKCFEGTLENIYNIVRMNNVKPPTVVVIGEVVKLRSTLNWFKGGKYYR